MAQKRNPTNPPQRRRRRRRNPVGIVITTLLMIALVAILGTVMLHACRPDTPETQPTVEAATPETTTPTQEVTVPPTTEPVTEPSTEPVTTEATTEPTTEATTEPTTEATTEPDTEPTEATTAPTEAPTAPTVPPTEEGKSKGAQIAEIAIAQIGKPYSHGSEGPDAFDTSGLVRYCCNDIIGTILPRTVPGQASQGQRVEKKDLLPGDVVFFWTSDPNAVEYVGIYIGDSKFVAARNQDKPVSELDMSNNYFSERYLFGCRYW